MIQKYNEKSMKNNNQLKILENKHNEIIINENKQLEG